MEKKEILKLVKKHLADNDLTADDRKIFLKLYIIYTRLEKIMNQDDSFTLADYDDEIYNLDNTYLTDLGKIKLGIKCYEDIKDEKIQNMILKIKTYINKIDKYDVLTSDEILYLKQQLVKIQILCDDEITFYEAAYKLFENYCNLNDFELKDNKKK